MDHVRGSGLSNTEAQEWCDCYVSVQDISRVDEGSR